MQQERKRIPPEQQKELTSLYHNPTNKTMLRPYFTHTNHFVTYFETARLVLSDKSAPIEKLYAHYPLDKVTRFKVYHQTIGYHNPETGANTGYIDRVHCCSPHWQHCNNGGPHFTIVSPAKVQSNNCVAFAHHLEWGTQLYKYV